MLRIFVLSLSLLILPGQMAYASYIKIAAGIHNNSEIGLLGSTVELDNKTLYPLLLALGFGAGHMHLELEFAQHENPSDASTPGPSFKSTTVGFNFVIDITRDLLANPYVGAGVVAGLFEPEGTDSEIGVAKQFFVGVGFAINPKFSLGVEARHMSTFVHPNFGDDIIDVEAEYKQMAFMLNTRFHF